MLHNSPWFQDASVDSSGGGGSSTWTTKNPPATLLLAFNQLNILLPPANQIVQDICVVYLVQIIFRYVGQCGLVIFLGQVKKMIKMCY